MLRPGVTQEWVDEGELPSDRTKNRRWRMLYDVLAEARHREVVVRRRVFVCASELVLDESLSHQHMGAVYHRGISPSGRKERGSDDESSGAQLPKSKASIRKDVDSEEHHSTTETDLPITNEEMLIQGNR
ncbi:hypothetical protein B296_00018506 [Ensete ventricosum]|uniref:Uncharacterized protein n=1 Tax=Ensete ventricosum TaxID=4639 RepID=A0A426ZU59_ENSVE|nr:hypothetical protein B296_00018506 [Ensete ventricosum]